MQKIISRKEAAALGLRKYFTGKPCKRGHIAERTISKCICLECKSTVYNASNAIYMREYTSTGDRRRRMNDQNLKRSRTKEAREMKSAYDKSRRQDPRVKEALNAGNRNKYRTCKKRKAKVAIYQMIRRCIKGFSSKDIGYTKDDLIAHMESTFADGMSWDNYGLWHIDHIKPIKAFFNEGVSDPKVINALENLQPLWAIDNLKKGAKYEPV